MHKVVDKFRFLNYYWGKCVFCLFLGSLSFSNQEAFVQWIMTIYFVACAICFLILAFMDRGRDKEQWKIDQKIIEISYREEHDDGFMERVPFVNYMKSQFEKIGQP